MTGTVIVGAGQAGAQLALSLREFGYSDSVTLVGDEPHSPYHRPPLSKDFLDPALGDGELPIRPVDHYRAREIDVRTGITVTSIDRQHKQVRLSSGGVLPYSQLVLATGARNRRLPIAGGGADNVHYLRTVDEARRVRQALERSRNVVVIGAGFIGLEFASAATRRGADVVVVEAGPRVLGRVVAEQTSAYFAERHRAMGASVLCDTVVDELRTDSTGRVVAVRTGTRNHPVDLVLIGIGVVPNVEIAEAAGLAVDDGILVDTHLLTSDPAISAIGDCARYPRPDSTEPVRLESVQNAADQSRYVARRICHGADPGTGYAAVPWFWSHQAGDKLQIAGLAQPTDSAVLLGEPSTGRFSVGRLRGGVLTAVETVNSPGDHLAARRLLASGRHISEAQLRTPGFSLRSAATAAGADAAVRMNAERVTA